MLDTLTTCIGLAIIAIALSGCLAARPALDAAQQTLEQIERMNDLGIDVTEQEWLLGESDESDEDE